MRLGVKVAESESVCGGFETVGHHGYFDSGPMSSAWKSIFRFCKRLSHDVCRQVNAHITN